MRVLVACEFSGIVRDAFRARGHEAISVDLLETESDPGAHIVADVFDVLRTSGSRYDLMIAHPPCTYLANSGVRWLYSGGGFTIDPKRWADMQDGARFFRALLDADIPRIAVENPVMHRYAQSIVGRGPDFTIQPWQFGEPEIKRSCFWTRNLPPLTPTNIVDGRAPRVHHASPGPNRWRERSRTLRGIADAMAEQWGSLGDRKGAHL